MERLSQRSEGHVQLGFVGGAHKMCPYVVTGLCIRFNTSMRGISCNEITVLLCFYTAVLIIYCNYVPHGALCAAFVLFPASLTLKCFITIIYIERDA